MQPLVEKTLQERANSYIYFSNTEAKEVDGLSLLCAEVRESSEYDDKSALAKFSWECTVHVQIENLPMLLQHVLFILDQFCAKEQARVNNSNNQYCKSTRQRGEEFLGLSSNSLSWVNEMLML